MHLQKSFNSVKSPSRLNQLHFLKPQFFSFFFLHIKITFLYPLTIRFLAKVIKPQFNTARKRPNSKTRFTTSLDRIGQWRQLSFISLTCQLRLCQSDADYYEHNEMHVHESHDYQTNSVGFKPSDFQSISLLHFFFR